MGAWRNASIIRSVTGRPVYGLEARIAFQEFGLPASGQSTAAPSTAHPGAAERAPARHTTDRAEVSA
jgi:lysine N6-hydroxylase